MDRKSKILCFSESLERDLSNGIIKVNIQEIKVFANLAVPWIIAHGPRPKNDKLGPQMKFWIETYRLKGIFLSFQKIIKFLTLDQTVLKLWLLKDVQLQPDARGEYSIHWIVNHHALPVKPFSLRSEGDLIRQGQLDLFLEFSLQLLRGFQAVVSSAQDGATR